LIYTYIWNNKQMAERRFKINSTYKKINDC